MSQQKGRRVRGQESVHGVMKQVTVRGQSGQNELKEKQEDERSEVNVGLKMQQMDWGVNGHEMVTGQHRGESEWVTWKQEEGSIRAMSVVEML